MSMTFVDSSETFSDILLPLSFNDTGGAVSFICFNRFKIAILP